MDLNIAGNATSGAIGSGDLAALMKALDSGGYVTDSAQLGGGGALRIQSLDHVMQTTIAENKHFRLFNKLPKPKAGATVDEWTEQNGVGSFLGGSTNSESGAIAAATGNYQRQVGMVKFLMTQRSVTFVQSLINSIADSEAVEFANGAIQLLSDAEYLCFEGDSNVVPTEFAGIKAQMAAGVTSGMVDSNNIVDARGQSITSVSAFNVAAAQIAGYGNFGTPTDFLCSLMTQADLDTSLDPAFRVPLPEVANGGVSLGAPVVGIRTSHGAIASVPDVFVRDQNQMLPFELTFSTVAAANTYVPAAVAGVAANDGTGASQFTAPQAGNYYYAVAGVSASGQSVVLKSSQVAVTAGQKVTLSITASASGAETGYVIYRGRLNGTNATNDFREMVRIGKTAGGTTTYVDFNQNVPGCSNAFILNMLPSATAITWRQLLPMVKFALYPTNSAIIPWAQMLFGYLRISKRRQMAVIKNVLPGTAPWRPFGV